LVFIDGGMSIKQVHEHDKKDHISL